MLVRMRHASPLVIPGLLLGLLAPAPSRAAETPLRERLDTVLARLGPHATSAVRVVSLPGGQVLYERNADLSLNPASNMKLVTSATALAKLGPDYRFTTRVLATAPPADGVIEGALVLQGGGDPVLETPDLEKLADALKTAGVRKVTGGLTADDFRYDAERLGIGWNSDDEPFYYSAQISALTLNRNVLNVDVFPGKTEGEPAVVKVRPLPEYVRVVAQPTTGKAGSQSRVNFSRDRARNDLRITGTIAVDGAPLKDRELTMEEPELFTAGVFRKLLAERGIEVTGETSRGKAPAGAAPLAQVQSRPLSEIVALLNKPSDNLVAEMLLKELGYVGKQSGTATAGSDVVEGWLKEIGIRTAGVTVNDGSGLSRMDLVTARVLSDLLIYADKQPWREVFIQSLPVAGIDGTLRNRMKETAAASNVKAKTGSLAHVSALSGYVTTSGGERVVFSVIINNVLIPTSNANAAKRIEDAIAVALAEQKGSLAAGR